MDRWWRRAIRSISGRGSVSQFLAPILPHLDRAVLRLSGGKATATRALTGLTVVWLTTRGAKSGVLRTTPLVGFMDGESWVLIASNFGSAHHPGWYYNLIHKPHAILAYNGERRSYHARLADETEREMYWEKAVALYAGYENYQERAGGRQIPVFVLSPER
jgi:deazaflavin-dependent oxidoreductase (nitroreductase family)